MKKSSLVNKFGRRFFHTEKVDELTQFDIHEYDIMSNFINDLPEGNIKGSLGKSIIGKGAFRRFKDSIIRFDLEEEWYSYQADAYKNIAVEWCEEHNLEYEG